MKAKQKIGFIFSNYDKKDYTGQPVIGVEVMKRLKKKFDLYLVSNDTQIKRAKGKKKELLLPGLADLKTYLFGFGKIVNFLKKNKVSLLYVQGLRLITFVSLLSRLLGIRFLAYICETPERQSWFYQKIILLGVRRAERIFVSCDYLLNIFQKLGVPKEKLIVVRVGLNPQFQNLKIESKKRRKTIFYLGDASKDRGFDRAMKIAEKMSNVDFVFLIRWISPDCKKLYQKAKKLKNISIEKYPDYSKTFIDHVAEAALVLLPPRYMLTRPPLSLIESMSIGKCVIISKMADKGSIEEVVINNENGLIYDFKNINQVINKINFLFSHVGEIERLGENARERIKKLYSEDEYKKIIFSFKMIFDKFYEWTMFNDLGGEYVSHKEKKALIELLSPKKDEKILDVGTGSGRFAREIIKLSGATIYGIDLDEKMLTEGKILNKIILNKDQRKHYKSFQMDGHNLKFNNKNFDKAFCFRVLKYYNDPYKGIDEIIRIQKKGGIFVLELTNNKSWESFANPISKILTKKGCKSESFWTNNMRLIDVVQVERYLKKKGIKILKSAPLHKLPPRLFRLTKSSLLINFFDFIDRFLLLTTPKALFSKSILLKCQK